MNESRDEKPPEFQPKIPLWMRNHYDALEPIQRWQCDMASVQEQQNNWIMEQHKRAEAHRMVIDVRVDTLANDVRPVVILVNNLKSLRSKIVAAIFAILIPMGLAVFGAWLHKKFGGNP